MHSEGIAYDWWHHSFISQDHIMVESYEEFVYRLITCFDQKDIEVNYRKLAKLKQTE